MPRQYIAEDIAECAICGNPANKLNTHLIPWFVIKYVVTESGTGVRDKQLSYTISPDTFTKVSTGRGILPEKLAELGNFHDLEKEKEDPYARDNVWCKSCEDKFSRLEAVFSTSFSSRKLGNLPDDLEVYRGQRIWINPGMHYSVYELFIHSIFWRCSKGRFDGFELEPAIEKKLLKNLQIAFADPGILKLKPTNILPLQYSFPLITSYLYRDDAADPTTDYISTNNVRWPYMIIGGRWIFQLFEKHGHIRSTNEYLYGLRYAMDTPGIYSKLAGKSHLVLLNEDSSGLFISRLLQTVSHEKVQHIRKDVRRLHEHLFSFQASREIENHVVNRYAHHLESGKAEFESLVNAFHDLKGIPNA
jgi:hypothetical protein